LSSEPWILFSQPQTSKLESTTGKTSQIRSNGHRPNDDADEDAAKNNRRHRDYFNIYNNCHNILRTLQSLLLLMLDCGIFNKRRRRQEHAVTPTNREDKYINYTKFLLLLNTALAATAAATTTRLSLSRYNYNNKQQQQQHNQLKLHQTRRKVEDQTEKQHCKNHKNYDPWNRSLIWVLLSLSLLANHATATAIAMQQQQQQQRTVLPQQHHLQQNHNNNKDDFTDKLDKFVESTRLRRDVAETNDIVRLSRNETTCKSMDIRNTPANLYMLENCTTIEGFLMITLMSNVTISLNHSFPLLKEVTDFVCIFRVNGLHSLSQIFPNLNVIRGKYLLDGYSFVVYSNPDLVNLGLPNLRSISHGSVRIEKNRVLCYVETIDWLHIMGENATESEAVVQMNGREMDCPKCAEEVKVIGDGQDSTALSVTGRESGGCRKQDNNKRYCWDSKHCQTICPKECRNNCIDENTCCNKACLGCTLDSTGTERCISCRFLSINNTICVDTCPKNLFQFDKRCITSEECIQIGTRFDNGAKPLAPFAGQCTTRCPKGYSIENHQCIKCKDGKCERVCPSGIIESLDRAKVFEGCTVIGGNSTDPLVISIKREGDAHVMDTLELYLGQIHTIKTSLKVHLTFGLTSLRFFKSLTEIVGDPPMDKNQYALYVLENNDLEEIWGPNQTVYIRNGGVFFHFNKKLCISTINKLLPMLASKPQSFNNSEVATDSNGSRGSCGTLPLNVTVKDVSAIMAVLQVDTSMVAEGEPTGPSNATIIFKDPRAFIGYEFFYMIDPHGNATKSNEQLCDNPWTFVPADTKGRTTFMNLKPYTQYAYYVRTKAIFSELTNAQSGVQHFMTKPAQPSQVSSVNITSISDSKIHVSWGYPKNPYGKLTHFIVIAERNEQHTNNPKDMTSERQYCEDPIKKASEIDTEIEAEKPKPDPLAGNCKCDATGAEKNSPEIFSDRRIQSHIEFENSLQNFVYVPRRDFQSLDRNKSGSPAKGAPQVNRPPSGAAFDSNAIGNQPSRQRRQAIDLEPELDERFGSVLLRHVRSTSDTKDKAVNLSKTANVTQSPEMVVNLTDNFVVVPINQTSYTFENLHHFTRYTIYISVCRETIERDMEQYCSNNSTNYKVTKRREDVDKARNLTLSLEIGNNTRAAVRAFWLPPLDPNGEIITYTLEYHLQKPDTVVETKCIPVANYSATDGYTLKGVTEGQYLMRVRANSLAGYGVYTDYVDIIVPPPQSYYTAIAVILGIAIFLAFSLLVAYIRFLQKKRRPNDLHMNTEVNPFYASMQYIPDDWEVLRENVIQLASLGQGSFGMVYEGIMKSFTNGVVDRPCAIKTVNENATDRERTNFLSEASVMKEFNTHHVVRLLGVCSRGQPALVVMELMKNGDLKSYLRAHRPEERDEAMMAYLTRIGVTGNVQPPTYSRIYQMAIEIADGMAYLAAKKFVHRDLAARNCMVAEDLTVKIGDFGMTRDVYETDYYRKGTKGLLPVRWMSPESLRDGVYSSASDVFSFGVVLWEMATLAAQPYQGLSNEQVLCFVIEGGVMERPANCPDVLHRLMQRCWHHRAGARPSFLDIIAYLEPLCLESDFKNVSFYYSEEGQTHREKERKERSQMDAFAAVPLDQDQQEAEQNEDATTPLRMGDYQTYKMNSSLDQPAESPIALVGDDHQATHSPFSMQSGFIASSTPDNQTVMVSAFHNLPASQSDDAEAPYVLPDAENNDRAYEIYDPSPNFADLPTSRSGSTGGGGGGGRLSGEQHLLPKKTGRQPVIMSSSMPDDVIGGGGGGGGSSSLQPSTASAASSNASSHTGRYPSLKRVVADTIRNRANMFNRHLFNHHKRTGSNASHKSNASNAPSTSTSNSNLTSHPVAMGNLGTIESGGSGSAGSYTGTPRFYTPTAVTPIAISDNPNYRLLDESMGSDGQATILTTSSPNPNYEMMHPPPKSQPLSQHGGITTDNPNYVAMSEPPVQMAGVTISHNPNYQPMMAPINATQSSSSSDENEEEGDEEEDEDDDVDDVHVEHIKMERMPLSRPRQKSAPPSRSRSVSQTRKKSPTNPNSGLGATPTTAGNMSNLLKESWLRPASGASRPPPPNGFIGREA
ncbi:hypothetical protein KR032_008318, partial [Drosophila birchii]